DPNGGPSSIIPVISTAGLPPVFTDAAHCRLPPADRVAAATRQFCRALPPAIRQNAPSVSPHLCRCERPPGQCPRQVALRMERGHLVCRLPDTRHNSSMSPTPPMREAFGQRKKPCQPKRTEVGTERSSQRPLSPFSSARRWVGADWDCHRSASRGPLLV